VLDGESFKHISDSISDYAAERFAIINVDGLPRLGMTPALSWRNFIGPN